MVVSIGPESIAIDKGMVFWANGAIVEDVFFVLMRAGAVTPR